LGSTVLDSAVATARAVLVLTDGIQNTAPDIPAATAAVAAKSPRQRVFAVGLGLNQLEDRLVQLASVTNGVAQITGELAGDREFLLQKLYVQILSDVSDEAFVQDPTEVIYPGMQRATDVWIGEVDVSADFIVAYRKAAAYPYVELWLEAPDGTMIRPTDAGTTFPNAQLVSGDGHVYFRVQFPVFPARPKAHVGRWRVWLSSTKGQRALTHGFDTGVAGSLPFVYSVMAKARSDLRLGGSLVQNAYLPGSPMLLTLEPTVYGQPVRLDPPVEVRVTRPDGAIRMLVLSETAFGQYRGTFDDTWQLGVYPVAAAVGATTPLGARVTRYRHFTGLIFRPGAGGPGGTQDGGHEPDTHDCREAQAMVKRLEALLERCSEHDPNMRGEVAALLRWLRAFVNACCRKDSTASIQALRDAFTRIREVVAALKGIDDDANRED